MDRYRIKPRRKLNLDSISHEPPHSLKGGKVEAAEKTAALLVRLAELQVMLYARNDRKVLVVLQGMDTSGKDGCIRHVIGALNPEGVRVASFKAPSQDELAHDYLWRVHRQAPAKGQIVVFNRSHYEDVLVVRVHELVPKPVWMKRYDHIKAFEEMLVDNGALVVKFFLHISKDEQRDRLQARVADPTKCWKFQEGDLTERKLWKEYQRAYEDALSKTSTETAPWYVVPANRKWYRDYVVASVLVDALETLNLKYPKCTVQNVEIK